MLRFGPTRKSSLSIPFEGRAIEEARPTHRSQRAEQPDWPRSSRVSRPWRRQVLIKIKGRREWQTRRAAAPFLLEAGGHARLEAPQWAGSRLDTFRPTRGRLWAMEEEAARSDLRLAYERGEIGVRSRTGSWARDTRPTHHPRNHVCTNKVFSDPPQPEILGTISLRKSNSTGALSHNRLYIQPNHLGRYCSYPLSDTTFQQYLHALHTRGGAGDTVSVGAGTARCQPTRMGPHGRVAYLAPQPPREVSKTT